MARQCASSGSPYEDSIGFCRAVRAGNRIIVAGTGPIAADGTTTAPGDAYGQARRCLEIIAAAVNNLGGEMKDVVRTRMFLVNVADWEDIGQAHGEIFADGKPAATMVAVKALIGDDWLVEIEAEAEIEER